MFVNSSEIKLYIAQDTNEETIFHTPFLFRRTAFVVGGFFGFCLFLFVFIFCNTPPSGTADVLSWLFVVLFCLGGVLAGFYGSLRRKIRLDYNQKMYQQTIGLFSFLWQRRGPFSDIQSIDVRWGSSEGGEWYRVGILWKQPRSRGSCWERLLNVSTKHYQFVEVTKIQAAEELAQAISARLDVPRTMFGIVADW